ncbi:MAG: hypothetical protein PHQ52_08410 [Candidatus Omnitrophica bacterium]|nr:hypothetical protein [Candidatus Omnitrophota bacterium]
MTKEDLLDNLKKMMNTEETAIPLYAEFIEDSLVLSPFSTEDKKQIFSFLKKLDTESKQHSLIFKNLIKKVDRNRKNVY